MSVTSQAGLIGFGPQVNGALNQTTPIWYRHKALRVGVGPNIAKAMAPPEIDGGNNPTGAYKTMAFYGGGLTMTPRLEGQFGWLLLGLFGYTETSVDGTTGRNAHVFSQNPAGSVSIPYFGFRRIIPGSTSADDLGESGENCIISSARFSIAAGSTMSAEFGILGQEFHFEDPGGWSWNGNSSENYDSVPVAMKGTGLRLPNWGPSGGLPISITNAVVSINNNTTSPQEEMVVGSYFPDSYTTRQRSMTIEATYKWQNPDLYRFIVNGGDPAQLDFKPCIDYTDFELEVESPCNIDTGTVDAPWSLKFEAPKIDWRFEAIQLSGDDMLTLGVTGVAIEADSTNVKDYMKATLKNTYVGYSLPT